MEKVTTDWLGLPTSHKLNIKERESFMKQLKENTAYLVNVCYKSTNPMHEAIFFMGFHNWAYCEIYVNNYDWISLLSDVYSIEIVKELYTFKI